MNKWNIKITICIVIFTFMANVAFSQEVIPLPKQTRPVSEVKISLDIKGMDILDVLKIISMKSGLNIVAGRNVTGRVTIFLKDVDVWDALELILAANSLAYEKRGNIINVMTDRDYELLYGERFHSKKQLKIIKLKHASAVDASKALSQIKTDLGRVVADEASNTIMIDDVPSRIAEMEQILSQIDILTQTKVFTLKYSKAEDILSKVTEMLTKNLGDASIDERTNKIVVKDTPVKLEEIASVLKEIDQKDLQVLIEAKILEVNLSDRFQMGIDWDYFVTKYVSFRRELSLDLSKSGVLKVGTMTGGTTAGAEDEYSAFLELLSTIGDVNTLSAPKITAVNNQESKILIGTREPYATKSVVSSDEATTTAEEVTFVDVGVKLYVTPTINEEGFVTMKIRPEVSSTGTPYTTAEGNQIPVVSTTEAETTVLVKDGNSIIIAGLIKDKQDKTTKRIPFLSNIPVLGKMFQSIDDTKTKKEVVILLTPHVITGDKSLTGIPLTEKEASINGGIRSLVRSKDKKKPSKKTPAQAPVKGGREALLESTLAKLQQPDYCTSVRKKIFHTLRKNYSDSTTKGEVLLSFVIEPDGNLKEKPVIIKEDNTLAGDLALQCIEESAPFFAFSEQIDQSEQKIKLLISFE